MTTYNTPNPVDQLQGQLKNQQKLIAELFTRVEALESARSTPTSEQHAQELEAIMTVFEMVPAGFKMSIPAIAENLNIDLSRDTVTTRVYMLVKANKLVRHQVGSQHPTFSRP